MNVLKAQLAPYAMLIKIGVAVLVGGVLFIGGCNYGKSNQAATVATLQSDLATANAANKKYEELNAERRRLDKLAAEENARNEEAAFAAAGRAAKARKEQETVEERNDAALRRALQDVKCADLMRMNVCEVVPLP